jgi:hypothetical protein
MAILSPRAASTWRASLVLVLPLIVLACGDTSQADRGLIEPGAALAARASRNTATVQLTVTGLPDGVGALLTVTGPGGYSTVVAGSTTLTGLQNGTYTITASPVATASGTYSGTPQTQQVSVGKGAQASAVVSYAAGETAPPGLSTGTLAVTIYGLPSGAQGAVTVSGAGGYTTTLAASQTLTGLADGAYIVGATSVIVSGNTYTPSPASQVATVSGGVTSAAAVTYAPTPAAAGTLAVSVSGLPTGAAAAVTVSGPDGYSTVVSASQTLSGLAAGTYAVAAGGVTISGTTFTATPANQSVVVQSGATASAGVAYASSTSGSTSLNLRVAGAYLTQSIQTMSGAVPLVAGRDGVLRVFAVANGANGARPSVRARLFRNSTLVATLTAVATAAAVPQGVDEASAAGSWNVAVPGSLIQPGLSVLADVDPDGAVPEANEADNAYPASGTPQSLDVRTVPALNVTFVPVLQASAGLLGNVSDANKEQYLSITRQMLPVGTVNASVRSAYTTSYTLGSGGSGWGEVLSELWAVRAADAGGGTYYGVVKVGYGGGVAGIGYIGAPVAMGWDYTGASSAAGVAAHELGHTWGRQHAPCGVGDGDPSYPYAGGAIGHFGFNLSTGQVVASSSYDIMGYCGPKWISDYTYRAMLDFRGSSAGSAYALASSAASVQPTLLVWGRAGIDGSLTLEPAVRLDARPALPARVGRYTVEGLDASGASLFSFAFEPETVIDGPADGERHFAFTLPLDAADDDRLASLRLSANGRSVVQDAAVSDDAAAEATVEEAGGGRVRLRWNAARAPLMVVRDPSSGRVLSFARGGDAAVYTQGAEVELLSPKARRGGARRVRVGGR